MSFLLDPFFLLFIMLASGIMALVDLVWQHTMGKDSRDAVPTSIETTRVVFFFSLIVYCLVTFEFSLVLLSAVVFMGVVSLVDLFFLRANAKRQRAHREMLPTLIDYTRSFFWVLLFVLILRTFVAQPYRVPTGSLEPTVMPGDLILVKQYAYGLRAPVWYDKVLYQVGRPEHGQIGLFHYPVNPALNFVKRVIGKPGDTISYIDKVLYINGKEMKQVFVKNAMDTEPGQAPIPVKVYSENLFGVKHLVQRNPAILAHNFYHLKVPQGEYFMMGDNRDDSDDSRAWGFVPFKDFIGEAWLVWMSWNSNASWGLHKIRWSRIGDKL